MLISERPWVFPVVIETKVISATLSEDVHLSRTDTVS